MHLAKKERKKRQRKEQRVITTKIGTDTLNETAKQKSRKFATADTGFVGKTQHPHTIEISQVHDFAASDPQVLTPHCSL
jgi:hypothetical protein